MKLVFHPQRIETSNGDVAWAIFDEEIGVWEIFTSETGEGYVGCADTLAKAKTFVKKWFA
jgi:hypothetical protein